MAHVSGATCRCGKHGSWGREAGRPDTRPRRPDKRVYARASGVGTIRLWCCGSGQGALARGCCMRASTLVQGASQGPRGGGTMTMLSGFSRCSRPETWEDVPASGAARGIEPCSPESGAGGTRAGPLREVVEGSSHCSPAGWLTEREVSDSHAAHRASLVWHTPDPHHGGSGWSRLRRPALIAVGCRRHAIVAARAARDAGDARAHPPPWGGVPRPRAPHSRA